MSRYPACLLLCLLALFGCGGGGGPSVPTFTFRTQWTSSGGGIDGQSQVIQLYDADNILRFSSTIDRPATTKQIFGVPNGTYHLHVDLHASAGGGGAVNGEADDLVPVSGSSSYRTAVGQVVTAVKITPASATFLVQHSQQFYARSVTASNVTTFTTPGGFNWQALGGVASVDQAGLAVGTAPGTGSITASNTGVGVAGAATLTIQPVTTTQTKWTVIVFMNASNDLWPDSLLNMNQMESVASNPDVRFVVEWKQSTNVDPSSTFNSTRRYLVKQDTTNTIVSDLIQDLGPGYDMGSSTSLLDFVTWAKANYPADRYCLVIWNHGRGWKRVRGGPQSRGVSYDFETGNHIETWQLSQALGNGVNDIVAWDSSLMQQLEVDEEIRDKASYIVGSEESPPAQGYPYDTIFAHFRDNPDDSTLNLAKTFVDETLIRYGGAFTITQSVIDTSRLSGLVTATSALSDALIANVGSLGTIVPQVRSTAQSYDDAVVNGHYRDLYDVTQKLEDLGAPAPVVTAGQAVRTAIGQAVVYEGHNVNSPGSHGISIDFSSASDFTSGSPSLAQDYQNLRFGQETSWGSWLSMAP